MRSNLSPALAFILLGGAAASAQTGPALLYRPWEVPQSRVEASAQATFFNTGETDSGAEDEIDLQIYESQGRFKLNDEKASPFAVGYKLFYMNIDTSDAALPERLVDQQVSIGAELFTCDGWAVSLIGGVGFASSNSFGDSDALYGQGSIIASKQLDERTSLMLGLDYDGNRTFLPDIPLPGIAYSMKVSDTFQFTVGIPASSIRWIPADRWLVNASVYVGLDVECEIAYELLTDPRVVLFAGYRSETRAFHIDGDDDHRRIIFEQKLLEFGVRWTMCANCEIFLVGGFAFEQEFTRGWDTRDTDDVRELSDEPFIRLGGKLRF